MRFRKASSKSYAMLTALLAAALFGAATPVSKALLASFPPFQLAGLLYLGAALGVTPIVIRKRQLRPPWHGGRKSAFSMAGSLTAGGIIAPVFLLFGLKVASGASVSMWLTLEGVATAVIGYLFFKEYLGMKGWLAVPGTVGSAMLLAWGQGTSGFAAGVLIALACICWGLDNNFASTIDGITPVEVTFWKGLLAGSVNLSIGLALITRLPSITLCAAGVGVGVFAYGISLTLYLTASQRLGATRAQMVFASAPFFGVLLSAVFLSESITPIELVAAVIFVGAIVLLFLDKHDHMHQHEIIVEHEHEHEHDDLHHDHDHDEDHDREAPVGRHTHKHAHDDRRHRHAHVSDLHHRHKHGRGAAS